MAPRTFTNEDANAALLQVRPLAERMVEDAAALRAAQARQAELARHIAGNGGDITPRDLAEVGEAVERAAVALSEHVEGLTALGCQVKDVDTGLVDFPAVHRGQPVLLCWRLGEDEVAHWHGLTEGFAGRKPLPFD
jgi:hypothetical protein